MFENKFNSKKADPLVEAAKQAMVEGQIRRDAIAAVNEEFGVYNRNAVVHENLSAYDARIEEAYKCMKEGEKWEGSKEDKDEDKKLAKKHGMTMKQWEKSEADKKHDKKEKMDEAKKLADKDYDKDGKIESPKDEVWGSRFRAAKAAGKMEEEQIDEVSLAKASKTARLRNIGAERDAHASPYDYSPHIDVQKRKAYKTVDRIEKKHGSDVAKKVAGKMNKDTYDVWGGKFDEKKMWEDEQLDEVSKKLLRRYVNKATPEGRKRGKSIRLAMDKIYGKGIARDPDPKVVAKEEHLDEAVSRKHFQQVADLIKGHESQEKRNELATHHAGIFSKQNPRFDHGRFHKAAGSTAHEAPKKMEEEKYSFKAARSGEDIGNPGKMFSKIAKKAGKKYDSEEKGKKVAGAILAKIRAKHMKEEQSFKSAPTKGKSVDEAAMAGTAMAPPAIHGPAIAGKPAAKVTPKAAPTARFGRQGAGARPMTATPTVARSMQSPSFMSTSKLATPSKSALTTAASTGAKSAATTAAATGLRAGLGTMARTLGGPAGAIGAAAAPYAAAKMSQSHQQSHANFTGHETQSDVKTSDVFNRMKQMKTNASPAAAPSAPASKPAIDTSAKGAKYASGKPHSVSTFAPSTPDSQAKVQSKTTEKGWNDAGAYENRAKSATGSMQQIRKGKVLDTATTQLGRPSASSEKSTQSFLNKELGRPEAPKPSAAMNPQQRWDAAKKSSGMTDSSAKAQTTAVQSQPADQKSTSDFMKSQGIGTKSPAPTATPSPTPTATAPKNVPTPPSRPAELDLPKIDTGPKPGPASVPNPKVNVPTPPSRPADLPKAEPMQNPDQNRTKVMKEEVIIGDRVYRIV